MLEDCFERTVAFIRDMLMFEDSARARLCVDVGDELLSGAVGAGGVSDRDVEIERIVSDSFLMLPPVVGLCTFVRVYVHV